MSNVILVGAQWGDEGKAKVTDLLAKDADVIIRVQGGCNAGHTVVVNNNTFKFHLVPSGILYPSKACIIADGTVINPEVLQNELQSLISKNISLNNLMISSHAQVTLPYHIDFDKGNELNKGNNKIGTTLKGIGTTYADKYLRTGIRVEDFTEPDILRSKIEEALPLKNILLKNLYNMPQYKVDQIMDYCMQHREMFLKYLADVPSFLNSVLKDGKNILFEGAQGTMLDIDHGTYPFVTSSNSISGGACTGAGIGPSYINKVIGISKAYVTRVGEGPFLSELNDETGEKIRSIGAEYGTTTGRPRRCGWFDAVVAKYAVQVNSLDSMAITKLDVLDTFETIKICVAYRDQRNGNIYDFYPSNTHIIKHLSPVYEEIPGWNVSTSSARSFEELPHKAQNYLQRIRELIGIPISIVSVGANREETIILEDPGFNTFTKQFNKSLNTIS